MKEWTPEELHRMYRYAFALAGERDGAYDLLQASLLRWVEASRSDVSNPIAYVMRMIRNRHFDEARRKTWAETSVRHDSDPADLDLHPIEQTLATRAEVEVLLSQLGDAERELLFLWAVEGKTIDEISTMVGVPRGTLLARLHRMRRRLVERRDRREGGTS